MKRTNGRAGSRFNGVAVRVREQQYEEAADLLGRPIDAATAFAIEMIGNLEEAVEHDDMTEELADVLSTETVRLTYEVNIGIEVDTV